MNDSILTQLNDDMRLQLLPAIIVFVVVMAVGVAGNVVICYIFIFKLRHSVQNLFLLCLGVFDLLSSCVGVPSEIYDMSHYYYYNNANACKALRFFTTLPSVASILILLGIASDRYRKICKPLHHQLHVEPARFVVVIVIVIAIFLSLPALLVNGYRTIPTPIPGLYGHDCSTDDTYKHSIFPLVYEFVFATLFVVSSIALVSIYARIWIETRRHKRYMKSHAQFGNVKVFEAMDSTAPTDSTAESTPDEMLLSRSIKTEIVKKAEHLSSNVEDNTSRCSGGFCVSDLVLKETMESGEYFGVISDESGEQVETLLFSYTTVTQAATTNSVKNNESEDSCNCPQEVTSPSQEISSCNEGDDVDDHVSMLKLESMKHDVTLSPHEHNSKLNDDNRCMQISQKLCSKKEVQPLDDIDKDIERENSEFCSPSSTDTTAVHGVDSFKHSQHSNQESTNSSGMTKSYQQIEHHDQTSSGEERQETENINDKSDNKQTMLHFKQMARHREGRRTLKRGKSSQSLYYVTKIKTAVRATRTSVIACLVTLGFILSYLPHITLIILRLVIEDFEHDLRPAALIAYNVFVRSYFFNNVINIFVYGSMNREFRIALVGIKDKLKSPFKKG